MSEQPQHNSPSAPAEQDVLALIKKMQQHLVFLEKKIDLLISQSQARPFREKHFSKPFRPSGPPYHRSDRGQDSASGERSFDRGRPFEKRHGEESRGFGHRKKAYDNPRESDFGTRNHFEKRPEGEKRGFEQKKKPFPYRQKDRG
jgi:hypothetical protein